MWDTFSPAWTSATTAYDINEDVTIGTTVVIISATDADDGTDGDVTYSITSATAGESIC